MTAHPTAGAYRHFHEQLGDLKQRLLEMSNAAERIVESSIRALLDKDAGAARQVVTDDAILNRFEVDIEQSAVALLALQQPMARDLRFIIGAIKISSELERVGDHAVNIAESAIRLAESGAVITPTPEIADMGQRARKMLGDALDAFVKADGALGRDVCRADDAVDALHNSVFRILLTHMLEDPRTITPSLEMLLVSRNLERIADLATNVAEDAVYLAEGKQIKHHFED